MVCADNTSAGLSALAECTTDTRQLNTYSSTAGQVRSSDRRNDQLTACSDAMLKYTSNIYYTMLMSVSVVGVLDLPVADDMMVL